MAAPNFTALLNAIDLSALIAPLLSTFGGLVGLAVIGFGAKLILEKLGGFCSGGYYFAGKIWDKDVARTAFTEIRNRKRSGALLDATTEREYKRYAKHVGW